MFKWNHTIFYTSLITIFCYIFSIIILLILLLVANRVIAIFTLFIFILKFFEIKVQVYYRKNSIRAFLNFKHLFLIPLFSLGLTMGSENACWFALIIYFLALTFKMLISIIYLKDDFIYALLAPINLKFGLPFHHYIFNDKLDWEYFFKREIKPEIVKLFHQAIFYYEENQFEVSKKLKKNINSYHSTLNNIRQIES